MKLVVFKDSIISYLVLLIFIGVLYTPLAAQDSKDYCASTYTNITDDWITNITFNTINNTTGQDGANSYGDYTEFSTDITTNMSYVLSVTFYSSGQWTEHVRAWFDWNADEVFDSLESYYLGSGVDATLTLAITVPQDAIAGITRFRVIEQYESDPGANGACDGQGNHGDTYGETEDYSVNIIGPPNYDVASVEFIEPVDTGQVAQSLTPEVTFHNNGQNSASFDATLRIVADSQIIYEQTSHIDSLDYLESIDFEFPTFTPTLETPHTFTVVTRLSGDEDPTNDSLTLEIFMLPQYIPPSSPGAIGNCDGVVRLSWFAPHSPICNLLAYDDGTLADGFYFYDSSNLIATMFSAATPIAICSVYVHVLTDGDSYWPWPDSHHDPVQLKIWDANINNRPDSIIADTTVIATVGESIVIAYAPPLICTTGGFWISFNNISDTGSYDAIGLDARTNYTARSWVYRDGVWDTRAIYPGDRMIRAKVIPAADTSNIITEEIFTGYNIYRNIQPDIPLDEAHRLVYNYTETLYDDNDVVNGTTYYYIITALYESGDTLAESRATSEISATPHAGGQLEADPAEITIQAEQGGENHSSLTLINDGDLDVNYYISPANYNSLNDDSTTWHNNQTSQAHFTSNTLSEPKTPDTNDTGSSVITDLGGPDDFGYIWMDSDESGGPVYNWIDPSGHETISIGDDENQGPFAMPFDFPFYGQSFSSFRISSNGFISFTNIEPSGTNRHLPSVDAPENLIAPFWDDLDPSNGGTISWYTDSSMAVISYSDIPHYTSGGPYTFQIVLYPTGNIIFQYNGMIYPTDGATTGIQNSTATTGLEIVYNIEYIHNQQAILIKPTWLRTDIQAGIVPANSSREIDVIVDALGLDLGSYSGALNIRAYDNSGELPSITVPVSFEVMTDIGDNGNTGLPIAYSLSQNYPNPFNPVTTIRFSLPKTTDVNLSIYNILGQKVTTLLSETIEAGYHSIRWDASEIPSGVYFCKLAAGSYREIQTMTLLK